jgi:predicted AAA+ superfamily ATPase
LLDEGLKVCITGSNASLLSKELGTKLTGRHIVKELYPFNYQEYLVLKKTKASQIVLLKYLEDGGFPEFLKSNNPEILQGLFSDILV